jgi:hypothetical protein
VLTQYCTMEQAIALLYPILTPHDRCNGLGTVMGFGCGGCACTGKAAMGMGAPQQLAREVRQAACPVHCAGIDYRVTVSSDPACSCGRPTYGVPRSDGPVCIECGADAQRWHLVHGYRCGAHPALEGDTATFYGGKWPHER